MENIWSFMPSFDKRPVWAIKYKDDVARMSQKSGHTKEDELHFAIFGTVGGNRVEKP